MIEIVFSESTKGSLRVAKSFNGKPPAGGAIAFISTDDGKGSTDKDALERSAYEFQRRHMEAWMNAKVIDGGPGDVFCFSLAHSYGDISNADIDGRLEPLTELLSAACPLDEARKEAAKLISSSKADFKTIVHRATVDREDMRIWYSDDPDELCGLHWFMYQLYHLENCTGAVFLVKLPDWDYTRNHDVVRYSGWGEVEPQDFCRYLEPVTASLPPLENVLAATWRDLMQENATLRAVLNGRLRSVPASIYDNYIEQELAKMEETFKEPILIGNVLGKYQLRIGDCFVALRIEEMIRDGKLFVVKDASSDGHAPTYRRTLRKCL